MLFVSRRNQSEPVSQTFSTSRRRFTNCAGKWPRGAAADLSRLTGRRADRLRANELQAEARLPRLVLVRLRLQLQLRLQLSCPHLHARRLVSPSQRRGVRRTSRNKTCSLCVSAASQTCSCTI